MNATIMSLGSATFVLYNRCILGQEQRVPDFKVVSDFVPTGDQPEAIEALAEGVLRGDRYQTLLGVTGSGKTFTMAKVAEQVQRPTLVIAHNKTLAAQLATEFREFLPDNAVEYFVSYYDYYQPEAYIPRTDTYIEKDASINDEIDRLRHAATRALLTRRDVLIVASVSCIYGLGDPEEYMSFVATVTRGERRSLRLLVQGLISMQYDRNDMDLARGRFRVRGDTLDIFPAYEELALRISFFGDEVERILEVDPLTGEVLAERDVVEIYPAQALRHERGETGICHSQHQRRVGRTRAVATNPGASAGGGPTGAAPPATIWRCSSRSAIAPASRTTRAISAEERPAARRGRCSTTSPRTTCCSLTSPT